MVTYHTTNWTNWFKITENCIRIYILGNVKCMVVFEANN